MNFLDFGSIIALFLSVTFFPGFHGVVRVSGWKESWTQDSSKEGKAHFRAGVILPHQAVAGSSALECELLPKESRLLTVKPPVLRDRNDRRKEKI